MSRIHVTVEGVEYDLDDMTVDECVSFERATGTTWVAMNPTTSALHCRAVLVEFYARILPRDEAEKTVGGLSAKAAVKLISVVDAEDDRPAEFRDGVPVVDPKAGQVEPATT